MFRICAQMCGECWCVFAIAGKLRPRPKRSINTSRRVATSKKTLLLVLLTKRTRSIGRAPATSATTPTVGGMCYLRSGFVCACVLLLLLCCARCVRVLCCSVGAAFRCAGACRVSAVRVRMMSARQLQLLRLRLRLLLLAAACFDGCLSETRGAVTGAYRNCNRANRSQPTKNKHNTHSSTNSLATENRTAGGGASNGALRACVYSIPTSAL